ncbi:hypothetical protein ABI59_08400 [Acidobacteria bacterium Mor1]|nr:hypothetical protein ABI59_08400 [Acidobacteria bacterium Mor1]
MALLLLSALPAGAHLNSPHVFVQDLAGPYDILLIAHMPEAIPGEAEVQVRIQDRAADEQISVQIRAVPPQGEQHAAPWVDGVPSEVDPAFFTAPVPLMVTGVWRLQARLEGVRGVGTLSVAAPAQIPAPKTIEPGLAGTLIGMLTFLFFSGFLILGSMGRNAHRLESAGVPSPVDIRRGRIWGALGGAAFTVILAFIGNYWSQVHALYEVADSRRIVGSLRTLGPVAAGRPVEAVLTLGGDGGQRELGIVPARGHMMHMTIVRYPDADHFWHINPEKSGPSAFRFRFEPPVRGEYRVFGQVTRESGEVLTVTESFEVADGRVRSREATGVQSAPFGSTRLDELTADAGEGYRVRWVLPQSRSLIAGEFYPLTFELLDPEGAVVAAAPVEGEPGRLTVMRADADVFAEIYPGGTTQVDSRDPRGSEGTAREQVQFPYGFPEAGLYRLWVQLNHEGQGRVAVFDVPVM